MRTWIGWCVLGVLTVAYVLGVQACFVVLDHAWPGLNPWP